MDENDFPFVDVVRVRAVSDHVPLARFPDEGQRTLALSDMSLSGGPMRDPALDATNRYVSMRAAGTLRHRPAAE